MSTYEIRPIRYITKDGPWIVLVKHELGEFTIGGARKLARLILKAADTAEKREANRRAKGGPSYGARFEPRTKKTAAVGKR